MSSKFKVILTTWIIYRHNLFFINLTMLSFLLGLVLTAQLYCEKQRCEISTFLLSRSLSCEKSERVLLNLPWKVLKPLFAPSLLPTQHGQWSLWEADRSGFLALVFMWQLTKLQGHLGSLWVSGLWPAWPSLCQQWSCSCQQSLQSCCHWWQSENNIISHFQLMCSAQQRHAIMCLKLILGIRIAGQWPLKF